MVKVTIQSVHSRLLYTKVHFKNSFLTTKTKIMYRLKVTYQSENSETGDIEKVKDEILVECSTYTEAEAVLNKLIINYGMDKYGEVVYEIVKCKFTRSDIYYNNLLNSDNSKMLTCGLLQCFFEDENHGLYAVDTIAFGNKALKEKDEKYTYLIPAVDPADATNRAKAILIYEGRDINDCAINNVKYDKAGTFYFLPASQESLKERSQKIFANYGL